MKPLEPEPRPVLKPVLMGIVGVLALGLAATTHRELGDDDGSAPVTPPAPKPAPPPASSTPPSPPRSEAAQRMSEGVAHARAGRTEEALVALDRAHTLEPTNDEVLYWRARVRLQAGDTERAIEDARAALIFNPDRYASYVLLDRLLLPKADFAGIVEAWTRYLARHPEDGRAWLERAGAHRYAGHQAEADADLREACARAVDEACRLLQR